MKRDKTKGRSEEELLIDLLGQITEADTGAFINVVKDESNELQNLFVQTSSMRNVMHQYGQVLLFDHTYMINTKRMPTALIMTMDGNGDGRVVGIAFLANERKENVGHTLHGFIASCGDEVISNVKTIVVDKDMSEIAALKVAMPHVHIQLCDFHVENVFNGRLAREHPDIPGILKKLRFAENEDDYQNSVLQLKDLASEKFWKYFEDNWLSCPVAWAYREKKESLNLGNPTNNRLESFNGKIKIILNPNNTLAEALEGILALVNQKDEDSLRKCRTLATKQFYSTVSSDPVVHKMLNTLTHFAGRKTLDEYKSETSSDKVERYGATETDCSCYFYKSFLMPCRHIFYQRRRAGSPVFLEDLFDNMWKKKSDTSVLVACPPSVSLKVTYDRKVAPKTVPEKYCKALTLSKQLCTIIADCGINQFNERYQVMKELLRIWAKGEEVIVLQYISNNRALTQDGREILLAEPVDVVIMENNSGNISNSVSNSQAPSEPPEKLIINSNSDSDEEMNEEYPASVGGSNDVNGNISNGSVLNSQAPSEGLFITINTNNDNEEMNVDESEAVDDNNNINWNESFSEMEDSADEPHIEELVAPSRENNSDSVLVPYQFSLSDTSESTAAEGSLQLADRVLSPARAVSSSSTHLGTSPATPLRETRIAVSSPLTTSSPLRTSSPLGPSTIQDADTSDTTPLCFCRIPSIRLIAGPLSRLKNRPYYKCSLRKNVSSNEGCKFWQIAPLSQVGGRQRTNFNDSPQNSILSHINNNPPNIESIDGLNADSLRILVDLMDQDTDFGLSPTGKESTALPLTQALQPTPLGEILNGLKLPLAVRPKGRPKGSGKTVHNGWRRKRAAVDAPACKKRKFLTPEDREKFDIEGRKERAIDIPDSDVTKCGNEWSVQSARGKGTYTVKKKSRFVPCTCEAADHCPHHFTCTCQDRRKPCKHIYKVDSMYAQELLDSQLDESVPSSGGNECSFCTLTGKPMGAHKCDMCGTAVHPFENSCSVAAPKSSEKSSSEGYGSRDRRCVSCHAKAKNLGVSQKISLPVPSAHATPLRSICTVCFNQDGIMCTCNVCKRAVHFDSECSVPDHFFMKDGEAVESSRCCRNCLCSTCKTPKRHAHVCMCNTCAKPTSDKIVCAKCKQPIHVQLCSKTGDNGSYTCLKCVDRSASAVSLTNRCILESNEMLTDELICICLGILKRQFPFVGGLSTPIPGEKALTKWPSPGEDHTTYEVCNSDSPHIQILHTGYDHWITSFKAKGLKNEIYVLDSTGSQTIGSFVEQQLALIMDTDEKSFTVVYAEVKNQYEGINECGPLAVAFATELAFKGRVTYVNFKISELRPHLLNCLLNNKLAPFPRDGKEKLSKRLGTEQVAVICSCRLPEHYDTDTVFCSKCRKYCHFKCHNVTETPNARRWLCTDCQSYDDK